MQVNQNACLSKVALEAQIKETVSGIGINDSRYAFLHMLVVRFNVVSIDNYIKNS